jgi:hypothetical protein
MVLYIATAIDVPARRMHPLSPPAVPRRSWFLIGNVVIGNPIPSAIPMIKFPVTSRPRVRSMFRGFAATAANKPVPIKDPMITSGFAGNQLAKNGPDIWPSAKDMVTRLDIVALLARSRFGYKMGTALGQIRLMETIVRLNILFIF